MIDAQLTKKSSFFLSKIVIYMRMSGGNSFLEQFAYKQSLNSSGWFEDITCNSYTTYGFTAAPTKQISAYLQLSTHTTHNSFSIAHGSFFTNHGSTKQA
jgi:hypothetical protein